MKNDKPINMQNLIQAQPVAVTERGLPYYEHVARQAAMTMKDHNEEIIRRIGDNQNISKEDYMKVFVDVLVEKYEVELARVRRDPPN